MIVKCERCQTRFKIPDEKVTEKGVKVRCTKCQNTFRVTREPATAEAGVPPAPSAGGQADPFAGFGVAPDPKGVEITKPGYFAQGVEATKGSVGSPPSTPWNSVDGDLDTESGVFQEPTRIGPIPLPPAARPQPSPFDLSGASSPGVASPGAVPLPAPMGRPGPSATGLYGSAVPPSETSGSQLSGGAVPLPGAAAAPRGTPTPPGAGAPGRMPPTGPSVGPASVTMFGSPKGGAQAPAGAGTRPPPAPGAPGAAARRPAAPAPDLGAPPPFAMAGSDPFTDLLGGPGPSAPGAFDDLPAPRPAPAADALRRAAAPRPAATPAGAVALGPIRPASRAAAPVAAPPLTFNEADPFASVDADAVTVNSVPVPSLAAADPFASIGSEEVTVTSAPAPAPAVPASDDPFASIDIDVGPAPAAAPARGQRVAAPAARPPAPASEDPFASIDIDVGPAPSPTAARGQRAAAPASDDPFASIDIDVGPAPVPAPAQGQRVAAPPAPGPAQGQRIAAPPAPGPTKGQRVAAPAGAPPPAPSNHDPFASLDLGGGPAPAPVPAKSQAAPASAPPAKAPAAPLPPPPSTSDLFDLSSDSDAFGEHAGMQPTDTGRAALLGSAPPSDGGLDEPGFGADAPGGSLLGDVPPVDEAQEFTVTLGKVGAPAAGTREVLDLGLEPAAPVVSVAKPTARPEDVGIPQSRPASRALKVTALVANLVVAAALVVALGAVGHVYLRDGRVDLSVLSPERLRTLVVPPARPLVAVDVSNALYETQSGRTLFFVRGEAENRTTSATRIRVRAALYDGNQRVRSAEALAGALPTPEDLYAVGNAEAATALTQRLDAAAVSVAPGAKAPFLVMFHEYPADLGSFRLEVTLEAVPAATAEAGRTE